MTLALKAVLFDWGDTLVHFPGITTDEQSHLACLQELFDELSAERKRECFATLGLDWGRFLPIYRAAGARQWAGSIETLREHRLQDRFSMVLRELGCACKHPEDELVAIVQAFARRLIARSRPVDGVFEVLEALRGRYRVGLVSNYPFAPLVVQSLEQFGILPYLETVVISGDVGWVKPHERPFRQALAAFAVEPGAALMVGDDLANDMRGANALGLRTAWLAPQVPHTDDPAVDIHLKRLPELLDHLAV